MVSPQPVDGVIVQGDVLNYTCDENYYFGGSNILTCTSDGTLIGDLGRCYRGEIMVVVKNWFDSIVLGSDTQWKGLFQVV